MEKPPKPVTSKPLDKQAQAAMEQVSAARRTKDGKPVAMPRVKK